MSKNLGLMVVGNHVDAPNAGKPFPAWVADLKGKKSAQSLTSNFGKLAQENGAELVGTDGFDQSIQLVLTGRADATINEDASAQVVTLTGISAGVGDVQPLRVSATSADPILIPNPQVTYASPSATGTLSYRPQANRFRIACSCRKTGRRNAGCRS